MNPHRSVKQIVHLSLLAMLLVGCIGGQHEPTPIPDPPSANLTRLAGKRVLFIIYDRFMDSEYSIPRRILEDLGATSTVASSSSDALLGSTGDRVQPDALLGDLQAGDYDAVVFVGGENVESGNPEAHRIAQEAAALGKVVAAICAAQATLVRAGVAEGRQATRSGAAQESQPAGANSSRVSIEGGGLVIMARGPLDSREFGEAIAAAMGK